MITRRDLGTVAAIGATGAVLAGQAQAQPVGADMPVQPPKGPWTQMGDVQRDGGVLHYAAIGPENSAEPPIVLLHKLGGWLSDWRFVAPMLATRRRVIAFDLPGHGGSRWAGPPPFIQTLDESAAALVGALEEMGIARIDLVGTSLGGCVSVPLAARWPEKVRKLALVSSALWTGQPLAALRAAANDGQRGLFDAQGNPNETPPERLTETFGIIHTQQINAESIQSRKAAARWLKPSERGVAFMNLQGMLKRVEAPTLLLYGDHDKKAYPKYAPGAQAALKDSRMLYVPDAGAFVMQDNPPATAEILGKFLNG